MYREKIAKLAPGFDPAHVEAYMRVQHPVIDALAPNDFDYAVADACALICMDGLEFADDVAIAHGLRPKKRNKQPKIFPRGCVLGIIEIKDNPSNRNKRKRTT